MTELPQLIANGLVSGGVYALVAVGYSLVYGVLRLINFAHGALFSIGAYLALRLSLAGTPFWASLLLATFAGALGGLLLEKLAYRPLREAPPISPLLTSLGIAIAVEHGLSALSGREAAFFPSEAMAVKIYTLPLSVRITSVQLLTLGLAVLAFAALWLLVMRTGIGASMRAVADDRLVATTTGMNVDFVIGVVFFLGSALASLAGVMVSLDVGYDPYLGNLIGFKAFAACVVGGIGSLGGAFVGGISISLFETFVAAYVSTQYKSAAVLGLLVLVLLIRPEGVLQVVRKRET